MATQDYLLADILAVPSEDDVEETLKDLLDQRSENHRHGIFLSKIYAVQDLVAHLNTPGNEIINEVVEALVELGYAFEDTFKKEIESDASDGSDTSDGMELTQEKIEELAKKFSLVPNPNDEDTILISGIQISNSWLALCRQSPDIYNSYGISSDKDEAVSSAGYGPKETRESSLEFFTKLFQLSWKINRNGWTIQGEAILTEERLCYHREN